MRTAAQFLLFLSLGFGVRTADAQYFSYRGGYNGYPNGFGYRTGPYTLTNNNSTVGRPGYQYGYGPSPFLWYNPRDGYFVGYNNGLPWNSPGLRNGPIVRNQGYGYSRGGVVRYSRPTQEPNETYYVRSRMDIPDPQDLASDELMPAVAEESEKPLAQPSTQPASARAKAGNLDQPRRQAGTRAGSTRRRQVSGSPAIRASGGADWVPALPRGR